MLELYFEQEYEEAIDVYDDIDFEVDYEIEDKMYRVYEECLNIVYGDE